MKLFLSESEKKAQELIDQIDKHPLTAKIREIEVTETLQKRKEAAGRIETLRKEQADNLPKLQKDLKEKKGEYQKAKETLQAASDEFQAAHRALSIESNRISREIDQQAAILLETANPLIDETIQFFQDILDDLRKPGRIDRSGYAGETNLVTMTKTAIGESNINAIKSALLYCQSAIKELEALKLSPTLDLERIDNLKAGIPRIDVFTESIAIGPIPGSKGVNPRHLLPSDSQMEWEIGKINEKFKKIMRK